MGYIGKRDRVGANDNDHVIQGTTAKTLTAEKQEDRIRVPFFLRNSSIGNGRVQ